MFYLDYKKANHLVSITKLNQDYLKEYLFLPTDSNGLDFLYRTVLQQPQTLLRYHAPKICFTQIFRGLEPT